MSFLVCKCCGPGNLLIVRELDHRVGVGKRSFRPVLAKTWVEEVSLETIIRPKFVILKRNRGGDLELYRRLDIDLTIESYSVNHIDANLNKNLENAWRFTGF